MKLHLMITLLLGFHIYGFSQMTLSLNGEWNIIFDENNEGKEGDWMKAAVFDNHPDLQSIPVPSAWELIKKDYEGVAFYKKTFDVPANWENKIIRLQFGAVNYLSEVWLNGEVVGFHEGGFTPFEFRVDEMIKVGETNELTLRVVGPITLTDNNIDGIGQMETAQWRGGLTAGIWQDVQLVATGEIYVADVFIQPNIQDHTASVEITLDHTGIETSKTEVAIYLKEEKQNGKTVAVNLKALNLHPGINHYQQKIQIPDAQYWSPETPNLYRAEIIIKNDATTSDSRAERFGMRELVIQDKDFYLNGKRIHIKATFFEGLYPNGIAYPDSEEMARQEIQLAKDAGFNMIRPWRRPPVPMWLDLADEMGVLVVGSPALECMTLPRSTPYLPKRVEHEVRQSILRDRNRACIVQWELFNELHRPVLKQLMRPMAMLARDLDPTRLILDESGGWAFGANMYLPHEYEPTKFNDIHNYAGPFVNRHHYEGYLSIGLTEEEKAAKGLKGSKVGRNVVPGLMSYVSELGYGSLPDLTEVTTLFEKGGNPLTPAYRYHHRLHEEQQQMLTESGFAKLYPDMQQFYLDQQAIHGTANKRMIEAVRANPGVDGYCIHALAAGDWILGAGLIDIWRRPKSYAYEATKAANQPRIVTIRLASRNVYAEQGTDMEIIGVNDLETIEAEISVEIINEKGKSVYRKRAQQEYVSGISSLLKSTLDTRKWKGEHILKVRLTDSNGRVLTENSYTFDVFQKRDLKLKKEAMALFNENKTLSRYLKERSVPVNSFSSATPLSVPVLVTDYNPEQEDFTELLEFIEKGGTAVYLQAQQRQGMIEADNPAFPFTAKIHPSRGLWTCMPHMVHQHPIFDGLPTDAPMRDLFENVWPTLTLRDIEMEEGNATLPIVGTVAFDWFSEDHKLHYSGPGASWWGSDLVVLPYGKGQLVVSQLRLLENIGKDPVADKIMSNLLKFVKN